MTQAAYPVHIPGVMQTPCMRVSTAAGTDRADGGVSVA